MTRLNRAIVREGVYGRPMRLLHGELVHLPDAGIRLTLVAAGHPAPLRLSPDGEPTPVAAIQPSLGGAYDTGFTEETTDLGRGEALLCALSGTGDGPPPRRDLASLTDPRRTAQPPSLEHRRPDPAALLVRVL